MTVVSVGLRYLSNPRPPRPPGLIVDSGLFMVMKILDITRFYVDIRHSNVSSKEKKIETIKKLGLMRVNRIIIESILDNWSFLRGKIFQYPIPKFFKEISFLMCTKEKLSHSLARLCNSEWLGDHTCDPHKSRSRSGNCSLAYSSVTFSNYSCVYLSLYLISFSK